MSASIRKQSAKLVCAAAIGIMLVASPAWSRVHDLSDRDQRYDRGQRYEHRQRDQDDDFDRAGAQGRDRGWEQDHDRGWEPHQDRSRTRLDIDISIAAGGPDICLPAPCEPVYVERIERVWIEPVYRTVYERVWREPVVREQIEQVWIEPVYEWRDVIRYDGCWNRVIVRERVLVCPGRWEQRRRQVVVCEGRWETIQRQELVTPGHWEQRVVRVPVERPPVAIRFDYRRW
ncbi:MAG TPA: hypothetical protein VNL70_03900 [Tepidisphaeraceae bacterium]|nr:hypothetical protein [Tepidisphaeraceae bacterium]